MIPLSQVATTLPGLLPKAQQDLNIPQPRPVKVLRPSPPTTFNISQNMNRNIYSIPRSNSQSDTNRNSVQNLNGQNLSYSSFPNLVNPNFFLNPSSVSTSTVARTVIPKPNEFHVAFSQKNLAANGNSFQTVGGSNQFYVRNINDARAVQTIIPNVNFAVKENIIQANSGNFIEISSRNLRPNLNYNIACRSSPEGFVPKMSSSFSLKSNNCFSTNFESLSSPEEFIPNTSGYLIPKPPSRFSNDVQRMLNGGDKSSLSRPPTSGLVPLKPMSSYESLRRKVMAQMGKYSCCHFSCAVPVNAKVNR